MNIERQGSARVLSVFSLVMITVTSVDSIRNLPTTALCGSQLLAYFFLAAIAFLIPTALVAAELSTALPKEGGVYIWVKEAFGSSWGFLAIWFQWIENVIWYPTILSFIAGTLAYLINPELATNKYYLVAVILTTFWGATLLNWFGMKLSARFSEFCGIFGLFIPMALIIALGASWIISGKPLQISLHAADLLPRLHQPDSLVALTGIILSFCGMEITTVYAGEVKNPQRDYPKALFISTLILTSTLAFGSLAIAIVIPENQISLVSGMMQAFTNFFAVYHLTWLIPILGVMVIIGGLGGLSNWIIAPSKGLMVAAEDGNLPKLLAHHNRHDAPTHLLLSQAIITSIISMVFLLMPAVNGSYWLLTALSAQLYMFMYILMFIAGIYLRYKRPDLPRPYRIPGGNWGIWIVAGVGITSSLFTLIIGFYPPPNIPVGGTLKYDLILLLLIITMSLPPFFLRAWVRKREPDKYQQACPVVV